jgi:hypothetical protein
VDRTLLPLWDYGWVDCGQISLPGIQSPSDAPRAYLRSPDFGTSFVGPKRDDFSDIHGPFRRDTLSEQDFVALNETEFRRQVASIRHPQGFSEAASDYQWRPIEMLVSDVCRGSVAIYMLRFTEQSRDRFHDWGHVLYVFREFLCLAPDLSATRIVFGYD